MQTTGFQKVFLIGMNKLISSELLQLISCFFKNVELIEGEPQKQVRYIPTQTFPPAQGLRADDLAGPRLVFCARVEMCDLHLHRLHLQVLRGDAGHLVSDLVALDGDVLALDAETKARMSHAKAHRDTAVTKEQAFYTITQLVAS